MDWQLIIVGTAVVTAIAYVGRRWYRTWFSASKNGACAGCSCGHEPSARRSRPVE